MWILNILAFNLMMVFVIEFPLGWIFGAVPGKKAATVILSNVITNPAVVLSRLSMALFLPEWEGVGIIFLEIAAVLTEGFIFAKCKTFDRKNPYVISLIVNLVSFLSGEVLNLLI